MSSEEARRKARGNRPNIVFITADQWRHDAFGFAGNTVVKTPHTDALATRGIRFRNAYCESPVCQPSRASLVTGQAVHRHGLWDNRVTRWSGRKHFPLPHTFDTFPRRLRNAGYFSGYIGKLHFEPLAGPMSPDWPEIDTQTRQLVLKSIKAFNQSSNVRDRAEWMAEYGFDYIAEEVDKPRLHNGIKTPYAAYLDRKGLLEVWLSRPRGEGLEGLMEPETLTSDDTLDAFIGQQACSFIHSCNDSNPFFLWVAPVGPHPPFDPPEKDARCYDPLAMPLASNETLPIPDNIYGDFLKSTSGRVIRDWDENLKRRLVARYYAKCTEVDRCIGKIVRTLDEAGLLDNTWIVVGSDHGEMLGDYGLMGKSTFYRSAVQVPALIIPPPGWETVAGQDEYSPVQNLDLTATMLDIAGANREGHGGMSLLSRMHGGSIEREAAFSEIAGFTMVATTRWKLVVDGRTGEAQQLFDLEADPQERNDLCGQPGTNTIARQLIRQHLEPFYGGSMDQIAFPDAGKQ